MISCMCILKNDYHNKFSQDPAPHIVNIIFPCNELF